MPDTPELDPDLDLDWGEDLYAVEFANNPEPRCPCVLLLDTSGSMAGEPIRALTEGLAVFRDELIKDSLAQRRVEIAIVTFGGTVNVIQNFVTVDKFTVPKLEARGKTPMGTAIQQGLTLVKDRKKQYKGNGVPYYRPWVFLITDGEPEGEPEHIIQAAGALIAAEEGAKQIAFFGVGVQNANMTKLAEICPRPPLKLGGLRFVDMFVWLSRSTQKVANSKAGDQVPLPPVNWGSV